MVLQLSMVHCLGFFVYGVVVVFVVAVAAVAGEAGFDDDLSMGVLDGSVEWTAKIGWMDLVVAVGAAEAVETDFSCGGREWVWKDFVRRLELLARAILMKMCVFLICVCRWME